MLMKVRLYIYVPDSGLRTSNAKRVLHAGGWIASQEGDGADKSMSGGKVMLHWLGEALRGSTQLLS
jgi:hypothetical protein